MEVSIVRGRIRIKFSPEMNKDQRQRLEEKIAALIGSARAVDGDPGVVSCALSIANFQKLKTLGGIGLSRDRHTQDVVNHMRLKFGAYNKETEQGRRAKAGESVHSNYKFKVEPFAHQRLGFQFMHAIKSPALFGDCGVGKTFVVLAFGDSLLKGGESWAFLVICPVNLIKHVWIEDAAKFSDLRCVGLREDTTFLILAEDYDDKKDGKLSYRDRAAVRARRREDPVWKKTAKRRAQARYRKKLEARFAQDADMFVINPENLRNDIKERRVRALCRRLKKEGKKICLIVDESSKLKSRTSRTYKSLKRIRAFCERCIIMTGTPSPNGLLDLWAQFSLLDGGMTMQPSYVDFRDDHCTEIILRGVTWEKDGKIYNATKWHPRVGAPMKVYRLIEPRMIRFKLEECIDLPPTRFIRRDVDMSAEQDEFYHDFEDRLFAELEGEQVTAKVAMSKLVKLREITGGFVRTDTGEDKPFNKDAPKMLELDRLLEQSIGDKIGDDGPPLKGIVWAQYQWECKTLVKRYQRKYGARGLFGGISSGAKDESIRQFRTNPNHRLLICHPMSAGHGLTLTEANYAFYYSLSYNFEEFYQSFRRITRPGQKRAMTIYFLVSPGTIDEELLDAIRNKKNLSDMVTDGQFSKDNFLEFRNTGGQFEIDFSGPATDQNASLQQETVGRNSSEPDG